MYSIQMVYTMMVVLMHSKKDMVKEVVITPMEIIMKEIG